VADPSTKEKNYIAMFFGYYDSTSQAYKVYYKDIPYTDPTGASQTGGTADILISIVNFDNLAAGPYGHTKMLEGVSGERSFISDDYGWVMNNDGYPVGESSYTFSIPSHSLSLSKTTFSPGDKVTITGPGITPESSVVIGTSIATINFISYEYLEFTVPSLSNGSYTLVYTDKAGNVSNFSVEVGKPTTPPSVPEPLKTIPVVSGLTGSISSIDVSAIGIGRDVAIDIECRGDAQILTKIYLDIAITKPDGGTWTYTTNKVDVEADEKKTFSLTFPGSEAAQDGEYIMDVSMTSELWVGSELRDSSEVDTKSRYITISDKPVILRGETIESLPSKFTLGTKSEFSIWVQNFGSSTYTLSVKMRIIHDSLVTTSPCGYRAPSPCDKNDCTMDCSDLVNYNYFDIPSSKVSVSAGEVYEFKLDWTPLRETKLGDYYLCADLCCDECT